MQERSGFGAPFYFSAVGIALGDHVDFEFAQRLLPPGLALIEQLAVPAQHGLAFKGEDRRLLSVPPVVRLIRVIEARESEEWRDKWLSQLRNLSMDTFHHVCRPLELGAAGADHVYLVFDWFPATLAEQIPATGLVNSQVAYSVLRQLAAGLEELHGRLGSHGGLCAEQVFVDSNSLSVDSRVWIGGVELGYLPYWSNGERLVPKSHESFPPEWQGTLREPSKGADVFALGLLAVELLAGHDARAHIAATPATAAESASRLLQQRGVWWKLPMFVPTLLSQVKRRPADGAVARRSFDWWHKCEGVVGPIIAVVVAMLFCTIGVFWHEGTLRSDRDAARDQAASAERSLRVEKDDNRQSASVIESLRGQLGEALTKIATIQQPPGPAPGSNPPLVPPTPSGPRPKDDKQWWSEKLGGQSVAKHDAILKSLAGQTSVKGHQQLVEWSATVKQAWDGIAQTWTRDELKKGAKKPPREVAYMSFRQEPWNDARKLDLLKAFWRDFAAGGRDSEEKLTAIKAAFQKVPVKSWLRTELSASIKPLDVRHAAWQRWESQPPKLTEPWRKRVDVPWDVDAKLREEEMLVALGVAEREWRTVDGRGDLTWSEFQSQLNTAVGTTMTPTALTVTSVWINEFNSLTGQSTVSFRLLKGTSPGGSGGFRTVDVHVDGSQFALDDETTGHTWPDETTHSYAANTPPITVSWRPGQTFQIKVCGERQSLRGGLRPTYINQTFTGPIAVWRLAQSGTIATGEHSLTLKVTTCPGPPPRPAELKKAMK